MSYVFHVLFALGTLGFVELGWVSTGEHVWAVPLLVLAPYVLGAASRRAFLLGRFRLGSALERVLSISPIVLQGVAIAELGWLATLERWGCSVAPLDGWLALSLLTALAPYFVYQMAAIDARARCLVFDGDSSGSARSFQLRLFLSAVLPFVFYLAGSSLIARSPVWQVRLEEVGLLGGLAAAVLLGVFLYGMPFFLRYAWSTAPIEQGWARTMLEQVAKKAGFRFRELLVWHTGRQMSNAAIVGFSERSRHVFFSDLLLQQLGPRELAAVFAHEMGHARRGHAAVFGAFALGFFLSAQLILSWIQIESTLWASLILLTSVGFWYLGFGYLSRRFELEADLESLRVVGDSGPLIRALELVSGAHAHERSSWRHFSTKDRVAFLQRAEGDPLVGVQLRIGLARWRKLGFALFALATLLELFSLARSWNEDWLVAELRLGCFEQAASRADAAGVDRDMAALARLAASAPADARDADSLERAASAAVGRGDLLRARGWLELARLRGREGLEPVITLLERAEREGTDPLGADLPRAWREALRSAPGR